MQFTYFYSFFDYLPRNLGKSRLKILVRPSKIFGEPSKVFWQKFRGF